MMAALTAIAMTLGDLLGAGAGVGAHAATRVRDLVLDSRDVRPGAAFVALQGGREHGMRYAGEALSRGAEVVLYDPAELGPAGLASDVAGRAVAVPALSARSGELARTLYSPVMGHVELAGVTGTNGKTTVAYLIAQAMTRAGKPCGYIGTLGHGLPPALTAHALTTPDCFTLHRELAALATQGGTHAALEVSSHALAQNRIAGLALHTAAFTNLTRDHLDAHGDLETYAAAKARLFDLGDLRHAVLNMNDAFASRLAKRLAASVMPIRVAAGMDVRGEPHGASVGRRSRSASVDQRPQSASVVQPRESDSVGQRPDADLAARVRSFGLEGLELEIHGRFGDARLRSPLVGAFNAENLLVALGVLTAWQVPLAEACAVLGDCAAPPGRLDVVNGGPAGSIPPAAPFIVVDYAHTPDGLLRVLETVRGLAPGQIWCVFGCGGERDAGKRAPMGTIAAEHADHLVVTDDNPRGEDAGAIVRDILEGVGAHPSVLVEHDRAEAIRHAVTEANPGDVVLIAGKGHETSQRIGAVERPFSDRDVALSALGERT